MGEGTLEGIWIDRTQQYAARRRGKEHDAERFTTNEFLTLDPLPCWKHLDKKTMRARIAALVADIEAEAAVHREQTGTSVLGPAAILRQHPHSQPKQSKKSPAPRFHVAGRRHVGSSTESMPNS